MKALRIWAKTQKLSPIETVSQIWGKGPKLDFCFSMSGPPSIERAYRTHLILPKFRKDGYSLPTVLATGGERPISMKE